MWRRISSSLTRDPPTVGRSLILTAAFPFTNNRTVNPFSPCSGRGFKGTVYIFWMNLKPPCPRSAKSHLLARINELVTEGSQFIISTHSPIIMAHPLSKIIQITEDGIHETTLEETDHYTIMKQFFDDRDRLLYHLFQDE